jgi:hypothetical protein
MAPSRTLKIAEDSKLHEDLVARLTSRFTLADSGQSTRHEAWRRAEESIMAYIPETEADMVRRNKRDSGDPKYTTIMLPYTYALLMSAHTYWTSVFFARTPVHQFAGRHGEGEMAVQALEALIAYQVEVGEMMAPYYIWLYDAGKYGLGVLGHYWCVETIHYGEIAEFDLGDGRGPQMYQATHEVEGYRGNRSYNISPYDYWHDPRVPATRAQDGEFMIVRKRMGWASILARRDEGYFTNVDKLKEHVSPDKGATAGSSVLARPDFSKDTMNDKREGRDDQHPAGMTFLEFYIMLIPKEWGLGPSMFPQKWCLTITEDLGLVVGASPLGYIHGKFPIDVLEPEVEGYGIYNRGIPEIMEPIQNTMDWLINTHFFNVRASMNNQFIVDPSKLVVKDVANSGQPGFVWRLRPEAHGTDIAKMFHQIPVKDATQGYMNDLQHMLGMGERTLGINDQIMGVLAQQGRKTATEVRTSTSFGVNRQKTITEYMSHSGMASHAQKLVQSSQQFYDVEGKLRIVGDAAQTSGPAFMDVTPESIAGFYSFIPVDGTLPVDRIAQANMWKEILIGATRMPPQIGQTYDFGKIFAWMAQLSGLKNINQMKVQVVPDEMAQQQAAAGNVVPLRNPALLGGPPGQGSPSASTAAGLNALAPPPPAGAY